MSVDWSLVALVVLGLAQIQLMRRQNQQNEAIAEVAKADLKRRTPKLEVKHFAGQVILSGAYEVGMYVTNASSASAILNHYGEVQGRKLDGSVVSLDGFFWKPPTSYPADQPEPGPPGDAIFYRLPPPVGVPEGKTSLISWVAREGLRDYVSLSLPIVPYDGEGPTLEIATIQADYAAWDAERARRTA